MNNVPSYIGRYQGHETMVMMWGMVCEVRIVRIMEQRRKETKKRKGTKENVIMRTLWCLCSRRREG